MSSPFSWDGRGAAARKETESQLWSSVQNKEHLLPRKLVPTAERRMETISVPSPVLHEHCQC